MDLEGWLRSLDLEQYQAAFRENDIDISVVSHLSDQDLKELGVSLGHRRKMLAAIAELSRAPETAEKSLAPSAKPAKDTERRQLTVMFCDLVGSTALSGKLDPEDMREIVGAYHHCCADLITKAGGFVAKYMGDGVLAYFGYPQAHEHDAERAVQAGLALVDDVPKLTTAACVPMQVRVGIATGLVVVGDLISTDGVDLMASEGSYFLSQNRIIIGKRLTPARVAELRGTLGRADNVGEQSGREHPVFCEIAAMNDRCQLVGSAVQKQRRRLDGCKQMASVDVEIGHEQGSDGAGTGRGALNP